MKKYFLSLIALAMLISLAVPNDSLAQRGKRGQGNRDWKTDSRYNRMYDINTVETITGEVTSVKTITPSRGMLGGVHVMLKTDKETIPVHLGPAWYLDDQTTKIMKGDKISVTGSRITYEEKPAIIASQITEGKDALKLRDDKGFPLWSGRGR